MNLIIYSLELFCAFGISILVTFSHTQCELVQAEPESSMLPKLPCQRLQTSRLLVLILELLQQDYKFP